MALCALHPPLAHGESPDLRPVPPAVITFDADAIQVAADRYGLGDPGAAARLISAAAPQDPVELVAGADGDALAVAETMVGAVEVDANGLATLSVEGVADIGIGFDGDAGLVEVVDGAVVQVEAAQSIEFVTRAVPTGVQLLAILSDANAPTEIDFRLDLPEGAELIEKDDGSIAILVDVLTELPTRRAGSGRSEVLRAEVATIGSPWAVDANGDRVATHYEVADRGIQQIVEVGEGTVFPVVADPVVQPPRTGCSLYSGQGTMGCWWEYGDYRGANFSIPWTTPADLGSSGSTVACHYDNLNARPTGWGNRISSMSNWTSYTQTYYTSTNKSGASRAVAKGASVGALPASLDNNFESVYLTCAYK